LKMTLLLTAVAVPINTVVGITAAINITRNEFVGKTLLVAMLDLPFSISPVVTGTPSSQNSPCTSTHQEASCPRSQ
jgi:sulfate transport system permease protein